MSLRKSCLGAACLVPVLVGIGTAQEAGGRILSLGTSFGFVAADNPDLDENSDPRVDASIGLNGGLSFATPIEQLEFDTNLSLRARSDPEEDEDTLGISDPNFRGNYIRRSRDTQLQLSGSLSRTSDSALRTLDLEELLLDEDTLEFESLDDLEADVTRLRFSANATLETRQRAPLGITYSLGISGVRYSEAEGTALSDETRQRAGIGLRAELTPTLQATANIAYRSNVENPIDDRLIDTGDDDDETDDDGDDDSIAIDLGLTGERPAGNLGADLSIVTDDDGVRVGLSTSRAITRPNLSALGRVGVTRTENGEFVATGAATLTRGAPLSNLDFDLTRRVVSGGDDNDGGRGLTTLALDYERGLTPLWDFGAGADLIRSDPVGDEDAALAAAGRVSLSRQLTRDWSLQGTFTHRIEDDNDGGFVSGNILSISLSTATQWSF